MQEKARRHDHQYTRKRELVHRTDGLHGLSRQPRTSHEEAPATNSPDDAAAYLVAQSALHGTIFPNCGMRCSRGCDEQGPPLILCGHTEAQGRQCLFDAVLEAQLLPAEVLQRSQELLHSDLGSLRERTVEVSRGLFVTGLYRRGLRRVYVFTLRISAFSPSRNLVLAYPPGWV